LLLPYRHGRRCNNALAGVFARQKLLSIITAGTLLLCTCATVAPTGADELDIAIRDTSDYLNDNIPAKSKIVILNIQSDYAALSEYIIDELIANAVTDKVFSVVDRAQLDAIRMELNFQLSGEVDDKSALEIGKFLGAQTIVSGAMSPFVSDGTRADRYRMRIRALNVLTSEVQGQYNRNIATSRLIAALMKGGSYSGTTYGARTARSGNTSDTTTGQSTNRQTQSTPAQAQTHLYKIGDTGPAGGLIFYDKGNNIGGWRYLEAAPANTEKRAKLLQGYIFHGSAPDRIDENQTSEELGRGMENTEYLISRIMSLGYWDTAAQYCDELQVNGFNDWYLPSIKELSYMYGNLARKELGGFRSALYWSSSGNDGSGGGQISYGGLVWNMEKGEQSKKTGDSVNEQHYVRACRRF
jgi:hypothetical protein